VLHERHDLPDAQVGSRSRCFQARHQPGAGGQLLRGHLEPYAIFRCALDVCPVERRGGACRCRHHHPRRCPGAPRVAGTRPAARLRSSQTSPPFRSAGLANTGELSPPGTDPGSGPFVCSLALVPFWKEQYASRTCQRPRRPDRRRDDARVLSVSNFVRDPRSRVRHGIVH
jgi:hypothetical protein